MAIDQFQNQPPEEHQEYRLGEVLQISYSIVFCLVQVAIIKLLKNWKDLISKFLAQMIQNIIIGNFKTSWSSCFFLFSFFLFFCYSLKILPCFFFFYFCQNFPRVGGKCNGKNIYPYFTLSYNSFIIPHRNQMYSTFTRFREGSISGYSQKKSGIIIVLVCQDSSEFNTDFYSEKCTGRYFKKETTTCFQNRGDYVQRRSQELGQGGAEKI